MILCFVILIKLSFFPQPLLLAERQEGRRKSRRDREKMEGGN